MYRLLSALLLVGVAHASIGAQQPPNCAVGGFVISPDGGIWKCNGAGQAATQVFPDWNALVNKPAAVTSLSGTNTGDQTTVSGNAGSATILQNARTINGTSFNGSANITVTAAADTLTGGVVSYAKGGIGGCAATSATTGTMTVSMTTPCVTITPTGAATFNASGGVAGQILVFSITTSGSSSFTLTWGTNFRKTGTLATGVTTARFFTVTFLCLDGTIWTEIARTAVQS